MSTSGPNAPAPDSWPTHTLKAPIASPASSAQRIPDGRSVAWPGALVTRTTATMARTIPMIASGRGMPSSTNPTPTGTTAASTPVVGATTPIRPTARPR